MKLTRDESMRLMGETTAEVIQGLALLIVEQYKQWFKAPKKSKKGFQLDLDLAGICALAEDLFETKRDLLTKQEVSE